MATRNIMTKEEPLLYKKSRPVKSFDARLHQLLDDMAETLLASGGVGLAAPQVGVLRRAVLVIETNVPEGEEERLIELINPEIIESSGDQYGAEGCLSFPDEYGLVHRPLDVTVRAQDRNGETFTVSGTGLTARCFCHEIDHLDGVVFTTLCDRMLTQEELEKGKIGEQKRMRIVFMGTPDFAAASLQQLLDDGFDVVGVFTQPDKPKGRGMELSASPVKELALAHGLPVFQPEKMRDGTALEALKGLQPDILAVVAYGRILPPDLLELPKYGAVNVHGSLLPKYRGAAPIQWSVLNGDKLTGVTTMYLANEMDTGDVIYTEETAIGEFETSGELYDRLKIMGAKLLSRTLRDIEKGVAPRRAQEHEKASYVKMLDKSLCPLDFTRPARMVVKQIYGLQPWPVATMTVGGETFRVFAAAYGEKNGAAAAGTILRADDRGIEIACGDGKSVLITELQAPGKKRMKAADFLRGHPIAEGTVL